MMDSVHYESGGCVNEGTMYKENIFKEIKKSQRKDLRVSAITVLKKKKKKNKTFMFRTI